MLIAAIAAGCLAGAALAAVRQTKVVGPHGAAYPYLGLGLARVLAWRAKQPGVPRSEWASGFRLYRSPRAPAWTFALSGLGVLMLCRPVDSVLGLVLAALGGLALDDHRLRGAALHLITPGAARDEAARLREVARAANQIVNQDRAGRSRRGKT